MVAQYRVKDDQLLEIVAEYFKGSKWWACRKIANTIKAGDLNIASFIGQVLMGKKSCQEGTILNIGRAIHWTNEEIFSHFVHQDG